jgi:hypothetical protein
VRGAKSRQKASSLDDEDLYDLIGRLKSAARKARMAVKDRTTAVAGLPDIPGITAGLDYRLNDTLGDREFVHHRDLVREVSIAFPINSISPRCQEECWET